MPDGEVGHYTGSWGPWMPGISEAERRARLRGLRALALGITGNPDHPLGHALRAAEDGEAGTLEAAGLELNRLPALPLRRLLSLYATLVRAPRPRRVKETAG